MKTYNIYHIPGTKIGCTSDLTKRMRDQGFTDWEILEEHTDIYEVSDREIQLQKEYGLPVDKIPYWQSVQNRPKLNDQTRHRPTKEEATRGGINSYAKGHLQKYHTFENFSKAGKIGGKIAGRISAEFIGTCPHCSKTIKGLNYRRWHGDNCKLKA